MWRSRLDLATVCFAAVSLCCAAGSNESVSRTGSDSARQTCVNSDRLQVLANALATLTAAAGSQDLSVELQAALAEPEESMPLVQFERVVVTAETAIRRVAQASSSSREEHTMTRDPKTLIPLTPPSADGQAYCVYVTDSSYCTGAQVLALSLRLRGTTRDILALVSSQVQDQECVENLTRLGVKVRRVEPIAAPPGTHPTWQWTYTKFRAWEQVDYQKLILLDADTFFPQQHGDHFFAYPELSSTPHPLPNGNALFQSGFMVLRPSRETFHELLRFARENPNIGFPGDSGPLNAFFQHNFFPMPPGSHVSVWNDQLLWPAEHANTSSWYYPQVYAVHFTGKKPWLFKSAAAACQKHRALCDWWAEYQKLNHTLAQDLDSAVTTDHGAPTAPSTDSLQKQQLQCDHHTLDHTYEIVGGLHWRLQWASPPEFLETVLSGTELVLQPSSSICTLLRDRPLYAGWTAYLTLTNGLGQDDSSFEPIELDVTHNVRFPKATCNSSSFVQTHLPALPQFTAERFMCGILWLDFADGERSVLAMRIQPIRYTPNPHKQVLQGTGHLSAETNEALDLRCSEIQPPPESLRDTFADLSDSQIRAVMQIALLEAGSSHHETLPTLIWQFVAASRQLGVKIFIHVFTDACAEVPAFMRFSPPIVRIYPAERILEMDQVASFDLLIYNSADYYKIFENQSYLEVPARRRLLIVHHPDLPLADSLLRTLSKKTSVLGLLTPQGPTQIIHQNEHMVLGRRPWFIPDLHSADIWTELQLCNFPASRNTFAVVGGLEAARRDYSLLLSVAQRVPTARFLLIGAKIDKIFSDMARHGNIPSNVAISQRLGVTALMETVSMCVAVILLTNPAKLAYQNGVHVGAISVAAKAGVPIIAGRELATCWSESIRMVPMEHTSEGLERAVLEMMELDASAYRALRANMRKDVRAAFNSSLRSSTALLHEILEERQPNVWGSGIVSDQPRNQISSQGGASSGPPEEMVVFADSSMSFCYWLRGQHGNAGDEMSSAIVIRLVETLFGRPSALSLANLFDLEAAEPHRPSRCFAAIGSIVHHLNLTTDVVWGSGVSERWKDQVCNSQSPLTSAVGITALRGTLSREQFKLMCGLNVSDVALGDPALLLPALFPALRADSDGSICLVPHRNDLDQVAGLIGALKKVRLITPVQPWFAFAKQISRCELVISSALHGIVVADALGVPVRWLQAEESKSTQTEGSFKYHDYLSVTDRGTFPSPSRSVAEAIASGPMEPPNLASATGGLLKSFPKNIFKVSPTHCRVCALELSTPERCCDDDLGVLPASCSAENDFVRARIRRRMVCVQFRLPSTVALQAQHAEAVLFIDSIPVARRSYGLSSQDYVEIGCLARAPCNPELPVQVVVRHRTQFHSQPICLRTLLSVATNLPALLFFSNPMNGSVVTDAGIQCHLQLDCFPTKSANAFVTASQTSKTDKQTLSLQFEGGLGSPKSSSFMLESSAHGEPLTIQAEVHLQNAVLETSVVVMSQVRYKSLVDGVSVHLLPCQISGGLPHECHLEVHFTEQGAPLTFSGILAGPSLVSIRFSLRAPGKALGSFVIGEAGVYQAHVWLDFVGSATELLDEPTLLHVSVGEPAQLVVDFKAHHTAVGLEACRKAHDLSHGRWIHSETCKRSPTLCPDKAVFVEKLESQEDTTFFPNVPDPWIWVPWTCIPVHGDVTMLDARLHLVGDSVFRYMFQDIVKYLTTFEEFAPEDVDIGEVPGSLEGRLRESWFSIKGRLAVSYHEMRSMDNIESQMKKIASLHLTAADVVVVSGGLHDFYVPIAERKAFVHRIVHKLDSGPDSVLFSQAVQRMADWLARLPCKVVWVTHPPFFDSARSLFHFDKLGMWAQAFMTSPRFETYVQITSEIMEQSGIEVLDLYGLALARSAHSPDGTHFGWRCSGHSSYGEDVKCKSQPEAARVGNNVALTAMFSVLQLLHIDKQIVTQSSDDAAAEKAVITAVTDGYDSLTFRPVFAGDWDFLFFTDSNHKQPFPWRTRSFPTVPDWILMHPMWRSRHIKLQGWKALNYSTLMWVDGRMHSDCYNTTGFRIPESTDLVVFQHPWRQNVSEEFTRTMERFPAYREKMERQKQAYQDMGVSLDGAYSVATFVLIWHRNERTIAFFDCWWNELKRWGHPRDQLSFGFCAQQHPELRLRIHKFQGPQALGFTLGQHNSEKPKRPPLNVSGHADEVVIGAQGHRVHNTSSVVFLMEPSLVAYQVLPQLPLVTNLNIAISPNSSGITPLFFVHPDDISAHSLPRYLKGCLSITTPHPATHRILSEQGLLHLMQNRTTSVVSLADFFDNFGITSIGRLQTDAEGMDLAIMKALLTYCERHPAAYPTEYQFESNSLYSASEVDEAISTLEQHGYELVSRGVDTVVRRTTNT